MFDKSQGSGRDVAPFITGRLERIEKLRERSEAGPAQLQAERAVSDDLAQLLLDLPSNELR
jgi:hypothetical protein